MSSSDEESVTPSKYSDAALHAALRARQAQLWGNGAASAIREVRMLHATGEHIADKVRKMNTNDTRTAGLPMPVVKAVFAFSAFWLLTLYIYFDNMSRF